MQIFYLTKKMTDVRIQTTITYIPFSDLAFRDKGIPFIRNKVSCRNINQTTIFNRTNHTFTTKPYPLQFSLSGMRS